MKLFFEAIVYIIIAIVFNYFTFQLMDTLFSHLQYEDRKDKKFTTLLVIGIIGMVLSKILADKNNRFYNNVAGIGFYLGGLFMIFIASTSHWYDMSKELRTFISGIGFCWLIWYCYKMFPKEKNKKDKKSIKKNKKKYYKMN